MTTKHVTVGQGFNNEGEPRVVIAMTENVMYMSPEFAKKVALDLLIQVDRIEKKDMWDTLKGE